MNHEMCVPSPSVLLRPNHCIQTSMSHWREHQKQLFIGGSVWTRRKGGESYTQFKFILWTILSTSKWTQKKNPIIVSFPLFSLLLWFEDLNLGKWSENKPPKAQKTFSTHTNSFLRNYSASLKFLESGDIFRTKSCHKTQVQQDQLLTWVPDLFHAAFLLCSGTPFREGE